MKKILLVVFIIAIMISQNGLYAIGESKSKEKELYKLTLDPDSCKEQMVINVQSLDESLESLEIVLPKYSLFDENLSIKLSQKEISFLYDEKNHKVTVNFNDKANVQVRIVLANLEKEENVVKVRGKVNSQMTDYKDFIFTIYDDSGDRQSEKNNTNETKEENFDTKSTQPITALSGNLNVDISISPYKNTILSGNDAIYNLVFKVTGSKKEYKNARIVVNLPITNYTSFSQNLSELKINDVTPTYNASTHQLIYQFNSIKSGRSYETIIKVNTKNGESPHNAQLKATASFQAENQSEITDSATVTINASSGISVTKQYKETRSSLNGTVQKAPFPGSYTIWDIKVSIPKKNVGQMFLKEGSKIVITDTFPSGLTYVNVLNNTPAPSVSGRTLTWEFNAPTLAQQKAANGELYTINLRVALRVGNNNSLVNTTQTNNASAKATFIDSKTTTSSASATITIVNADAGNGTVTGTWYIPNHFGPSNGNGGVGTLDQKNPNPVVYDDALLRFDHGIAPLEESKYGNFQKYTTVYKIDPNLIFVKLKTPGGFMYRPNSSYPTGIPLAEQPRFNIVATVNGQERTLVVNAQINKEYTRKDLGLSNTDVVSVIKYDFT